MGAVSIGEKRGREYQLQPGSTSAKRGFKVRIDQRNENIYSILGAAGVDYGAGHPDDSTLYALDFSAKQFRDSWQHWDVDIRYQNPDELGTDFQLNPLLRAAEIDYDTETDFYVAPGTVNQSTGELEDVFMTSAGEPYDPQPEQEVQILVVNISRNEPASFSVDLFARYNDSTNSAAWTIGDYTAQRGQAKLRARIGRAEIWKNPATGAVTVFRPVDYQIKIHPLGVWDIVLADAGSYYKEPPAGGGAGPDLQVPFVTTDMPPVPYIGYLDGSGGKLGDGANPVFNQYENKRRLPFSALFLPPGP